MSGNASQTETFGVLLRRHRLAVSLSQEELAERARLSTTAIQALERGRRTTPRQSTLTLLINALGLSLEQRATFVTAASGSPAAGRGQVDMVSPLPVPLTSLLGREHECAEVLDLIGQAGARLVTITGPGGIGKTRLALAVATEKNDSYADGVAFVDLAPVRDQHLVTATIARSLGLGESVGVPLTELLVRHLRQKHMLLLVDNFEHVVGAAPLLRELLINCPKLVILTTSRAALRLRGEQIYPVPPLSLPLTKEFEAVSKSAAVALFAERSGEALGSFVLTPTNASVVVEICRRLDGLPLAIELAAARTRALSLQEVLEQLTDRLGFLAGGFRDLPLRQQTLRATLDWSVDLLTHEQRRLFVRLGVFVGGCSLDAARSVCNADGVLQIDVLDGLEGLVDQSLLRQDGYSEDVARFSMLETIREYAATQLVETDDEGSLKRFHAGYFLELAETAEPQLNGPNQAEWLRRLEIEHDNLAAAMNESATYVDPESSFRFVGALWRFWELHGHLSEGRAYAEQALAKWPAVADDMRAAALHRAGVLAWRQGDYDHAQQRLEESLALSTAADATSRRALILNNLGNVAWARGDFSQARARYEQSLQLRRGLNEHAGVASCLNNLGTLASDQGDFDEAWARHQDSLDIRRALGHQGGIAQSLQNLGEVALRRGELALAERLYSESLVIFRDIGERLLVARNLDALARVAEAGNDPRRAARLFGAAARLRAETHTRVELTDMSTYERSVATIRASLGDAEFTGAWSQGEAMSLADAIHEALHEGAIA